MKGLQKMLGLDGIDFEALGKQLVGGIDDYNKKLDLLLSNQKKIMLHLGIFDASTDQITDVIPVGEKENGSSNQR